jgi:hypothetical protein
MTALPGWNFCCGHTETRLEKPLESEHDNGGKVLLIDNPWHKYLVEIDTKTDKWKLI